MNRTVPIGLSLLAAVSLAAGAGAAPEQKADPASATPVPAMPAPATAKAAPATPKAATSKGAIQVTATPEGAASRTTSSAPPAGGKAAADMTLKGGEEGTVFRSLTVEGEDRIHIEVERPPLRLELDPEKAPGLDWGTARDVLDRTTPDLDAPFLTASAVETSPYVARPWLERFSVGPVARFQPDVKGVEHWKLTVVNARAEVVASYQGRGEPPRELTWDGRLAAGGTLMPGATYSYVLEARDKAGNKRNFVGEGFRTSAIRFEGPGTPSLAFTGRELEARSGAAPTIVLEAASWLNQWPAAQSGVRVEAIGKSADEANSLASRVTAALAPSLLGDPARIRSVITVLPDAPEGGAVRITPGASVADNSSARPASPPSEKPAGKPEKKSKKSEMKSESKPAAKSKG